MNCPSDGTTLVMSERQGVEIDYCPQCRGVWLDRGELDKVIDRSQDDGPARPVPGDDRFAGRFDDDRFDDDRHDDRRSWPKKRKRSFLSELFED